jgi:hypothetical protein
MLDSSEMQRIAQAQASVSDKIRALDRAGVRRADIARFLKKRYQHVRNVLEADKQREPTNGVAPRSLTTVARRDEKDPEHRDESPAGDRPLAAFRVFAEASGDLVLPRHVLEAFGARPREVLVATARAGELVLRTPAAAIGHAQELVRILIPGDDSLAGSLVEDRRREVESEGLDG